MKKFYFIFDNLLDKKSFDFIIIPTIIISRSNYNCENHYCFQLSFLFFNLKITNN